MITIIVLSTAGIGFAVGWSAGRFLLGDALVRTYRTDLARQRRQTRCPPRLPPNVLVIREYGDDEWLAERARSRR